MSSSISSILSAASSKSTSTIEAAADLSEEEALEIFDFDYSIPDEAKELQACYYNTNGVYRPAAWDFECNPRFIDANLDPRINGHYDLINERIIYTPQCLKYWEAVLESCTDETRLFRHWTPICGREVFGVGSIVIRAYQVAKEGQWYDFSLSDRWLKESMVVAHEALSDMNIRVPEVLFAGSVSSPSTLVTRRTPGIALDSIVHALPTHVVRNLDAQIERINDRLRSSAQILDHNTSPSNVVRTAIHPKNADVALDLKLFEKAWAAQKSMYCLLTPELQGTHQVDQIFYDTPEEALEASLDSLVPPWPTMERRLGEPLSLEAPVYGGVESDLDTSDGELTYRNVIVSAGRIVGVQGVAIADLLTGRIQGSGLWTPK